MLPPAFHATNPEQVHACCPVAIATPVVAASAAHLLAKRSPSPLNREEVEHQCHWMRSNRPQM